MFDVTVVGHAMTKRQQAAALQTLARLSSARSLAKRFGVRKLACALLQHAT
jgi:hypothetical protein